MINERDGAYNHGVWHKMVGLLPQYDHMEGSQYYDDYMAGYNSGDETDEEKDIMA